LEYLWKAAKAQFDPEDPKAAQWVADKIEQLLHGQVHSIVRHLRRGATLKGMSPKQREPIDQCATYLDQRAHLRRNIRLYITLCLTISCMTMEKRANVADLILTVPWNDQKTRSVNQKVD